jgi:hypothetical protein
MSDYWRWWIAPKGATLNLAKLHPKLSKIEMEARRRDWLAWVEVDGTTYESLGPTRPEALAELLNDDELIEALGLQAGQGTTPPPEP